MLPKTGVGEGAGVGDWLGLGVAVNEGVGDVVGDGDGEAVGEGVLEEHSNIPMESIVETHRLL